MIENIPLPRLLNSSGNIQREIMPEHVSVNLEITPLSYASMNLPQNESIPARSYVELFTCMGSAGIYRVRSPQDTYGTDTATAELEHAVVEVGDYLVLAKYSQMMDAAEAVRTVFNHYRGSKWQLGNISALASSDVALEADHNRVLEAMLAILDQVPGCMMSFDFSTSPWTINIVSRGTTVAAEGRLSRNLNYARVTYDDSELCTRAWYEKSIETEDGFDTEWAYVDADTMSTYGLIEREVQTGSNFTPSEALRVANLYISKHKNPRVNIETSLDELSCVTGETLDTFTIGKLCRLALPDYNVTIERHITGLAFPDVYGTPRAVNAKLAEEEDTAINFLHDLDTKGGSVSGGGGGGRRSDDAWKEFRTEFYQTDKNIGLVAEHVDHANNVLEAAGIDISTETGVLIYDDNVENGIGARFNLTEEQIRSEVYASNSQLWSEVVQTASYIRSEVHNSLSSFYTEILQTASSIIIRTGTDTETYHQPTAPTGTPDHPLVDGDLWFNSEGQFTWSDAAGNSWLDDSSYNWRNLVEADIYRYNGSEWVKIVNEQAIMQDTRFEQNNEHIQMVAGRVDVVDGNVESYRAEFQVEADQIRSSVSEQVAGLTSSITQTSREIRSEVSAGNNALRSQILQTATQIMMTVENKEEGLVSSITQEANRISLVVEGTGSNAHIKPASIVAAINNGASNIIISADHIALDGYVKATDITADYIKQKINAADTISVKKLSVSTSITFANGGATITNAQSADIIRNLRFQQTGNTYKLQKITCGDGSWEDVGSFSRAVSSWSVGGGSGKVNVTANPQNQTKSVNVSIGGPNSISSNGDYTYKVYYENESGDDVETGASMSVSVNVPQGITGLTAWNSGANASLYYFDTSSLTYKQATGSSKKWYYKS